MSGRRSRETAAARAQRSWRFLVGNTVSVAATVIIAATTLWPVYQSSAFIVMAVATIILGSALALVGAIYRWPSWAMLLGTLGIFLVAGVPLAVPGQSSYLRFQGRFVPNHRRC